MNSSLLTCTHSFLYVLLLSFDMLGELYSQTLSCITFFPFILSHHVYSHSAAPAISMMKLLSQSIFHFCILLFFFLFLPKTALKHSPSKRKSLSKVAHQKSTESEADSHGNYRMKWNFSFSISFFLSRSPST